MTLRSLHAPLFSFLIGLTQSIAVLAAPPEDNANTTSKIRVIAEKSCTSKMAGGLEWSEGRWTVRGYRPDGEFFLRVYVVDTFVGKSTSIPMSTTLHFERISDARKTHCGTHYNWVIPSSEPLSCTRYGETIIYDVKSERGAVSALLGSVSLEEKKDSLFVEPFVCR
jgi:hypothetical protein